MSACVYVCLLVSVRFHVLTYVLLFVCTGLDAYNGIVYFCRVGGKNTIFDFCFYLITSKIALPRSVDPPFCAPRFFFE